MERLGRAVPVLVDLRPSGEHDMEHAHADEAELDRTRAQARPRERPAWAASGHSRLLYETVEQADAGCDVGFMRAESEAG